MQIERFSASLARRAFRSPTLPPATHTNAYALGSREFLLVETPPLDDAEVAAYLDWVRSLEAEGRTLTGIFLTHHHPDHVAALREVATAFEVPVYFHEETQKRVFAPKDARLLNDGDRLVLDGPTPVALDILHTPGHASGHLCLYDAAAGDLVCGDMVATEGTILIAPDNGHMATYLKQLERLDGLAPRAIHPAHGAPILRDDTASGTDESRSTPTIFQRYIGHRLTREAKILLALEGHTSEATASPFEELLAASYPGIPEPVLPFAGFSLRAHLQKVLEEGVVGAVGGPEDGRPLCYASHFFLQDGRA